MKSFILGITFAGLIAGVCEARPRYYSNSNSNKVYSYTNNVSGNNSTAQGVAEMMAARNTVSHFGGNSGYEGCGSGFSQQ